MGAGRLQPRCHSSRTCMHRVLPGGQAACTLPTQTRQRLLEPSPSPSPFWRGPANRPPRPANIQLLAPFVYLVFRCGAALLCPSFRRTPDTVSRTTSLIRLITVFPRSVVFSSRGRRVAFLPVSPIFFPTSRGCNFFLAPLLALSLSLQVRGCSAQARVPFPPPGHVICAARPAQQPAQRLLTRASPSRAH